MATENNSNFTPGITGNLSDSQPTSPAELSGRVPFYGETPLTDNKINFPIAPISSMPAQSVRPLIGSPGDTENNTIPTSFIRERLNDYTMGKLKDFDSTEGKNNFAKIYAYDNGPDSNAFYDRYAAFGEDIFNKVGFSPIRDNESNFNANTTWWDNTSRMLTHSFLPLLKLGFKSPIKSLGKMITGDFTGSDLDEAAKYSRLAAVGQDSRGGVGSFFNNTLMNFSYTAGIIVEAISEEILMTTANALSGVH